MGKLREKLGKIMWWKPDMRLVAAALAAALVLLMSPLLRLACLTAPYYDDYSFGNVVKSFLGDERSLGSALRGALYCARTNWYAWQGTYSASFLNSLVPSVWGEQYYFWGPVFLILILPLSVLVLTGVLVRSVLKADRESCVALQAVVAAMTVVLLHSPQQGFFWYVGGMCYVGMHAFLMLTIAAWVKLLTGAGRVGPVLLVLGTLAGAVVLGGSTYVTGLQGILLGLGLVVFGAFILRRKRAWLLVPSLLVYGYGFYKNVSAPGNAARMRSYAGWGYPPVEAVLRSFQEAFLHLGEFSGWITVSILILLVPIVWRMVGKSTVSFRFPGLVLLGSFCLYATGFTPTLFAQGHGGYARVLNPVKITYQLLLVLNEVYWLGWLRRVRTEGGQKAFRERAVWWFYLLTAAGMLFIFSRSSNPIGHYSSWGAYYYVHTGEAYNFYQEYLHRVETIVEGGPEVVVEPYVFRPWFLCIGDLKDNPDAEENRFMAAWYDKEAIICLPQEGGF